jgi:hypothetical protein
LLHILASQKTAAAIGIAYVNADRLPLSQQVQFNPATPDLAVAHAMEISKLTGHTAG